MEFSQKVIIITGHYGAGKTNLAVNLALGLAESGKSVTIAELDIVNPYFRSVDFAELFRQRGIRLAASDYAGANKSLDIPALSLNVKGEAESADYLIIDVGGDKEGARALARFALDIRQIGYEMVCVINKYRHLTPAAEQAVDIMRQIEAVSGLECTAVFNNSHLCDETTEAVIAVSVPFAEEVSSLTGLPLMEMPVEVYVKPIWEEKNR